MKSLIKTVGTPLMVILLIISFYMISFANNNIVNIGIVTLISGDVQILRQQQTEWKKINIEEKINVGDKIKLGSNAKLEVCYNDGSILRLTQNSEIEFLNNAVKLFDGQVWIRLVKTGNKFEVVTPTFVAGVRGTVFAVNISKKENTLNGNVRVWEGKVEAYNQSKSVTITEGMQVLVDESVINTPQAFNINESEFKENLWQAENVDLAYKRYINLLYNGIDQNEISSNPDLKKQIELRKKLPEVLEAYNTYKNLSDNQILENTLNN